MPTNNITFPKNEVFAFKKHHCYCIFYYLIYIIYIIHLFLCAYYLYSIWFLIKKLVIEYDKRRSYMLSMKIS